ncbi:MOSC domain-containing protein [Pseudorhodobacter turbinis]|uniref:MOSC domain-containing protein n=1 Tax=Pseudorhodobacter turbinis TaxID=2500533 RepID=A0A4P8EFJ8_9RHOB|nr:MOSC N-terminal beta barrel domain-containing protein [Pseudorhodobacter turbinis]QCO55245.1 MOSC domain-containing protein [Pseudorhodobacter turbinis]
MTQRLARICRHPIKAHGREDLASVLLSAGACLPGDRRWAVAHEAAKLVPGWNPCSNFHRGAKAPQLMAITAELQGNAVTLRHPQRPDLTFHPDDPADLLGFLDWIAPLSPKERAQPKQIVSAPVGMTDSAFPSVSILSSSSLATLSESMGTCLSADRFRGNLWLNGAEPFAEFDWIGRDIALGDAILTIKERITRCRATMTNPETGQVDADTLAALKTGYGHQDFGVYAVVKQGGTITLNDEWSLS